MKKSTALIAVVTMGMSIAIVFHIKYCVKNLMRDTVELTRQIASDKEAIHVLDAEWAYLNQPARLKSLARQYLDLTYIVADQIKSERRMKLADNHASEERRYSSIAEPTLKPILSSTGNYE